MKKTGVSVDFDAIAVDDVLDIYKYLMEKNNIKCLDLFKNMFSVVIGFIGLNIKVIPLKCVSISNQECKVRPTIMNINKNEPLFYIYSILVNKCSVSFNNINDLYTKFAFLMLLRTWILIYLI